MSVKSPITCHVLDASLGRPAQGVYVSLQKHRALSSNDHEELFSFDPLARGSTNEDGRCTDLLVPSSPDSPPIALEAGIYKITFKIKEYFEQTNRKCFYPWAEIIFQVEDPSQHYHIPLLVSPYSYTTYRGS